MAALDLAFSPLLPLWALIALAAATVLLAGLGLIRRAKGTWLRAAFAAVLLLALANPALVREQREGLEDLALVVVDRSSSQRIGERTAQTDAALARLQQRLETLPDTEIRVIESSGQGLGDGDGGTRLFGEIGRVLSEVNRERVGAVFMIGDGQVHDVPEDAAQLGLDAPLHLLRTGEDDEADRRLTLINAPSYGLVGRPLELTLRVDDLPTALVLGAAISLAGNFMQVAEAEFAFRFGKSLPRRDRAYAVEEVLNAVESLHPAIEIPDSRYHDFAGVGAPQLIADNACACWFVLGEAAADWRGHDLARQPVHAKAPAHLAEHAPVGLLDGPEEPHRVLGALGPQDENLLTHHAPVGSPCSGGETGEPGLAGHVRHHDPPGVHGVGRCRDDHRIESGAVGDDRHGDL